MKNSTKAEAESCYLWFGATKHALGVDSPVIDFICNPTKRFRVAALKERTGVPKHHVRELLSGEADVQILTDHGKTYYQFRSPQNVDATVA